MTSAITRTIDTPRAITGRVFFDTKAKEGSEPSKTGLAKVAVSDTRTVVLTADDGSYTIEDPHGPFVFVSLPRGYRSAGPFYARTAPGDVIDFPLIKWEESSGEVARFVQITDIHMGFTPDTVSTFKEDLAELDALEPKPSFVLATGDITHEGKKNFQFENYREGIDTLDLPYFDFPGNHDVEDNKHLTNYHNCCGPDYYSFNFSGCHFVLINGFPYAYKPESLLAEFLDTGRLPSEADLPGGITQLEWLKQDLAAAPSGSTIVFGAHFLPSPTMLRLFTMCGAKAVLSGHWHGHRVREKSGLLDLNSPPFRFAAIDHHPRGFRVVEISPNGIQNELRLGGFKQHAVIVAPQGIQSADSETLPLLVNAYDTRFKIESITCQIGDQTISLHQTSDWSWAGEIKLTGGTSGNQTVVANVQAQNGESWQTESSFDLDRAPANLALKWAAPTGGFIGISSPRVSSSTVVLGVDDTGNLDQCGVTAFDLDGTRRWHFATDSGIKNHVALADGRVFASSVAGWLYALDEMSGKLLWKAELGQNLARWETTATQVVDGVVHVGASAYIAAFEAATGRLLWETAGAEYHNDFWPNSYPVPVVAHGKVILSHLLYGGAFALDARSGIELWKLEGKFSSFAADKHSIYAVRDGLPTALDIHTGKPLWQGSTSVENSASHPVMAGDRVLIGTADGRVIAFSKQDGTLLWEYQTGPSLTSLDPYKRDGSDVNGTPVVAEGRVFVGASDGALHVISLDDGAKIATYPLGVPIASSPTMKDKTLYIGAYDGNVYAFTLHE
jgi:outer membrane protein assembly factor BamB